MSRKFHTWRLLVAFTLMMVFIQSGSAIQCYVCDSSVNPGCANLKSNSSIVPETCTLEKMKTINTWLFELNEISYFKTDIQNIPPMNCQKVVAKKSPNSEPITARFCQLDTRDTDACSILKDKLLADRLSRQDGDNRFIHCSICSVDRCNDSERMRPHLLTALGCLFVGGLVKLLG